MSKNFVCMVVVMGAFFCTLVCYGASKTLVSTGTLWDAFLRTWEGQVVVVPPVLAPLLQSEKVKITHECLCHIFPYDFTRDVKMSKHRARKLMKCHYGKEEDFMKLGITLQNKKVDVKTGVMVADMTYKGIISNKSFFPACWNRMRVMLKILDALKHPLLASMVNDESIKHNGKRIVVFGKTAENIVIKMVINNQSGDLITAFPDAKMNGFA